MYIYINIKIYYNCIQKIFSINFLNIIVINFNHLSTMIQLNASKFFLVLNYLFLKDN